MTDETTEAVAAETTPENNNVNISIEQICAAILTTVNSVQVSLEDLIANYSGKSIAVNQDTETKAVTFTLVDNPAKEDESAEADTE